MLKDAFHFRASSGPKSEMQEAIKPWKAVSFVLFGLLGVIWGRQFSGGFRYSHCTAIWLEWIIDRPNHCCTGDIASGVRYLFGSGQKEKTDIAMGNIIGSNIFNLGLVLGAAAVIRPMDVERAVTVDGIFSATSRWCSSLFLRDKKAWPGPRTILFLLYLPYLLYIILRG